LFLLFASAAAVRVQTSHFAGGSNRRICIRRSDLDHWRTARLRTGGNLRPRALAFFALKLRELTAKTFEGDDADDP
jgi:hypothetical protein